MSPYIHPLYHWPPKSKWLANRASPRAWGNYDVYVHYPFCRNICDYCGYETRRIDRASGERLSRLLTAEVRDYLQADDFSMGMVQSVFFGGGTASLLSEDVIQDILDQLSVTTACEVTLECEPGTISRRKLTALRQSGVNRVSICAQSFNDVELHAISRKHSAADVFRLVEDCISAGFTNLHIDLMYGLPNQTSKSWEQTIRTALSLPVAHLSAYKLFVFKYGNLHRTGYDRPGDEDLSSLKLFSGMYENCQDICANFGLSQYTLTEFAKPGKHSVYLTNSFSGKDLLPIGPSAFGRCGMELWENSPYLASYGEMDNRDRNTRTFHLNAAFAFKRQIILGLWLLRVDIFAVARHFGVRPNVSLLSCLKEIQVRGDAEYQSGVLAIPKHKRFYVGHLMASLALLPLSHWVEAELHLDCYEESPDLDQNPADIEIATIFRVARRDSELYDQLRTAPYETIKKLSTGLSEDVERDLAAQIGEINMGQSKVPSRQYQQIWLQVIREHGENQ